MFEQRQDNAKGRFGIDCASTPDSPVAHLAGKGRAAHLLNAYRIAVDVYACPDRGAPAPDPVDIGTARRNLFDVDFAAENAKPARHLASDCRFTRRAT